MGVLYTLISSITGSCYIENGKVMMGGTVSAQGHVGACRVTLTLQKNAGEGWKADGVWTATGSGTVTKYADKTAQVGIMYRLKISGTVTVNGASETDTVTTRACAL